MTVYTDGQGTIAASDLNKFVQTYPNAAMLRSQTGGVDPLTQIPQAAFLQGYSVPGDGGQGLFFWNQTSTSTDDNGITTIVPSPGTPGAWLREVGASSSNLRTSPFWWRDAGSGLMIQGGTVSVPTNGLNVSFPNPYSTSLLNVQVSIAILQADAVPVWYQGSITGFTVVVLVPTTQLAIASTVSWLSFGF